MASFDVYKDSPNAIKNEGQEIAIKFERTSPTTGRISWNIPDPLNGCEVSDQAYDGIIVTLDTTHTSISKSPKNGELYEADPTSNIDIHAGDRLDTSLIIGAFYHDKNTTFFDVTDIEENTPYYVSGYAVDAVNRYHTQGVHSYSLNLENDNGTDDTAGCQDIRLLDSTISPSDPTNLTSTTLYTFDITIDDEARDKDNRSMPDYLPVFDSTISSTITIDGSNAQTYQELINEINYEFLKIDSPFQGTTPPNTNGFYWDTNAVYIWDGYKNVKQDAILELSDPTIQTIGDLWYDTILLNRWDGSAWQPKEYFSFYKELSDLDCGDYWFNGSDIYNWDGNVWCETASFFTDIDPTLPTVLDCGTFWHNTQDEVLYKLTDTNDWVVGNAVYWDTQPNNLTVNTFWYNDDLLELNKWDGGSTFNSLPVITSTTQPNAAIDGNHWFNPNDLVLAVYDSVLDIWNQLPVLVFNENPTSIESCDVWWDSVNDTLYVWDIISSSWELVSLLVSETDPLNPPTIKNGSVWKTSSSSIIYKWDGVDWVDITFNVIKYTVNPNDRIVGDVWFNSSLNIWNVWDGVDWVITDIVESLIDPNVNVIPLNTLWFDTTNNTLQMWNGLAWIAVAFSVTSLAPINDTLWFDLANNELYTWRKNKWNIAEPKAVASLVNTGIRLCSGSLGHASNILVHQIDGNLFVELHDGNLDYTQYEGTDGVQDVPLYAQLGVGTDGSPDERRELITSIKYQLGYPAVEVELTPQQYDYCIDGAIEELRKRSGAAYKRGFFFIDLTSGSQRYLLTNNGNGFNKIVRVMAMYRTTSAFLGALYDNAQFGQTAINHLYNMGSYDLISFHIVADYIEQLEQLFATRVLFQFNENTRALDVLQAIHKPERMLMDVSVERTEQDLIQDRMLKPWIENFALAQAMLILSQIRGKYGSLPGANGISLNASDLYQTAIDMIDKSILEIEDYVIEQPEEFGLESTIVLG